MVKLKESLAKSKFLDNSRHAQEKKTLLKDKLMTAFLVLFMHLLILVIMYRHGIRHLQSDSITLVNTFDMVEIDENNQKSAVTVVNPPSSSKVVPKITRAKVSQEKTVSQPKKIVPVKSHMAHHSMIKKYRSESVASSHNRGQGKELYNHNEQSEGNKTIGSSTLASSSTSQTGHKGSEIAVGSSNGQSKKINREASYMQAVKPIYPLQSKQNEEQGTVRLRVTILANGSATNIRIIRSSGYTRLDQAALDTVNKKYRFSPALRGGKPYMSDVEFNIKFVLSDI